MSVRTLCTVVLCLAFLTHACLSAIISTRENQIIKEENVKTELEKNLLPVESDTEHQNKSIQSELKSIQSSGVPSSEKKDDVTKTNLDTLSSEVKIIKSESISRESSEDSSSEEKYGVTKTNSDSSSESLENGSSQEENSHEIRYKRSLDDQGSLNNIAENKNQPKENNGSEKAENNPETGSVTETTLKNNEDVTLTTVSDASEEKPSEAASEETESTTTTTTGILPTTIETTSYMSETSGNVQGSSSAEDNTVEETPPTTEKSEGSESSNTTLDKDHSFTEMAMARAVKLSEQIRKILMHYRKEKVVVVPGQSIFPEPMKMQDIEKSFAIGKVNFKNMTVHGLSNFTVEHINTDLDRMQVFILLKMKKLYVLGNYTLSTFWSRSAGPFNVTLLDVNSEGVAAIETTEAGHLEATDSEMDMEAQKMIVDFKGLGTMLQSMIDSVGDGLFDNIKPQILDRVNLVIRKDVNEKLKDFSEKFVNKVNPIDLAFSEGRRYVKEHGYDPLNIDQHTFVVGGIVNVNISEFTVKGLSRFNKVGNLSLSMDAGIIQSGVHVLTQQLTGGFKWSGEAFGIARSGKTNFTIDQLQVKAIVNQSLDLREKPQLDEINLHLGWLKVTMQSPMALNMMVEGIINAFPRLIKHMIVDALEVPLKEKIQEILNLVNVEAFVDSNLPRLDSFGL